MGTRSGTDYQDSGLLAEPGAHDGLAEAPRVSNGRRLLARSRSARPDGYRHLDYDFKESSFIFDGSASGPILGISFQF